MVQTRQPDFLKRNVYKIAIFDEKDLSNAILWGFITVIIAFAITMTIGLLYMYLTKTDPNTLSNIPDLQQLFSITSLYLLVTLQPFCEEFFFRGFLLEKITKSSGPIVAIVSTSILFGISHLSYTYAYTAIIAVILGCPVCSCCPKNKKPLFSDFRPYPHQHHKSHVIFFREIFWDVNVNSINSRHIPFLKKVKE